MHVYNERITYKTILKLLIGSYKLRIIRRLNLLVNQPSLYIYIYVRQYIIVMVKVTT
jgi:hypothetical protein